MELYPVALYSSEIRGLDDPAAVVRFRRDRPCTEIRCTVEDTDAGYFARHSVSLPQGHAAPEYRMKFALYRGRARVDGVGAVLRADWSVEDPEHRMMTPLYTNEDIILFEFQRAEVLCVSPGGEVLSRLVAVHRRTGQVGTETLAQFHTRYLRITNRCEKYMMGQLDLYPLDPSRLRPEARPMPDGPPDLGFFGRKS